MVKKFTIMGHGNIKNCSGDGIDIDASANTVVMGPIYLMLMVQGFI